MCNTTNYGWLSCQELFKKLENKPRYLQAVSSRFRANILLS